MMNIIVQNSLIIQNSQPFLKFYNNQAKNIIFEELKNECKKKADELGIKIDIVQSNIEGEIVSFIQDARNKYNGIIINAAGFTHTSVAIRDALEIFKQPSIELHISNIYNREDFRHKSLISKTAKGVICGFGASGYIMSLNAMKKFLQK